MAKFFNYRNIDFKLNNQNFYATQISLSVQASVEPVVLSDGSLLNYAPQGSLVGSLNCEFYLTGALPSFLNITGTDESAIATSFAGVDIPLTYPKSLSFNVEPFEPIRVSAEFDWYGSIETKNFSEQSYSNRVSKSAPSYIASAYKSYLSLQNDDDANYFDNIVSFNYNISCDRPAFFNIDEVVPFRVAKLNKTCEVELSSNKLGSLLSIDGDIVYGAIYLKDFYGTSIQDFNVSGVLTSQNHEISEGNYMLTKASIQQTITEQKTLV